MRQKIGPLFFIMYNLAFVNGNNARYIGGARKTADCRCRQSTLFQTVFEMLVVVMQYLHVSSLSIMSKA